MQHERAYLSLRADWGRDSGLWCDTGDAVRDERGEKLVAMGAPVSPRDSRLTRSTMRCGCTTAAAGARWRP